ncbi:TerB family tellurite resistance protein [Kangiella sp. M94]
MHIIIGLLTALGTLLYVMERMRIDIGWLNPWAWKRRRAWAKLSAGNPVYGLDKPIDAIALIATAAAKIDGDLSIEEKEALKNIFRNTFNQSEHEASQLLGSSVYLLGPGEDVFHSPEKVLQRSLDKFSAEQKVSSMKLLSEIIHVGGAPSSLQQEFVNKVERVMNPDDGKSGW